MASVFCYQQSIPVLIRQLVLFARCAFAAGSPTFKQQTAKLQLVFVYAEFWIF
jgi:hypothetical protein